MVCNAGMLPDIDADRALIARLGGPAAVARQMGLKNPQGCRRVCNWLERGIPASARLQFPHLFLQDGIAPHRCIEANTSEETSNAA